MILAGPRRAPGPTRTVTLPGRAFVVHYGNAFERDGVVHLDACLFHDYEFGGEFGIRGPHAPLDPRQPDVRAPQRLFRVRIPDGATAGTWQQLAPHGVDFPRVHPAHEGRETALLFGATRADTRHSDPFDSPFEATRTMTARSRSPASGSVQSRGAVIVPQK
jgi:carotenoid cleavage dioxygenase-like enzyme